MDTTYLFGAKGILYWQFRPESLGVESPGYGLVGVDGTEVEWTHNVKDMGSILAEYGEELSQLKPIPAQAGVIYSPEGMIFDWAANGNSDLSRNEHYGFIHALMANNIPVDFLHPLYLERVIQNYKVVYLPFPNWIDKRLHELLKEFVKGGGTLLCGPSYGQFDTNNGLHSRTIPGYGAEKLF